VLLSGLSKEGRVSLVRALGIELEWNPLSTASHAARAERAGRTGEALRLYVKAGQYDRVRDCLLTSLPESDARSTLLAASSEWLALRQALDAARDQRLPEGWTEWFADDAEAPGEVLWRTADRIAAASRHNLETLRIRRALVREAEKLTRLAEALREARASLAELALSEGGQPLDYCKRSAVCATSRPPRAPSTRMRMRRRRLRIPVWYVVVPLGTLLAGLWIGGYFQPKPPPQTTAQPTAGPTQVVVAATQPPPPTQPPAPTALPTAPPAPKPTDPSTPAPKPTAPPMAAPTTPPAPKPTVLPTAVPPVAGTPLYGADWSSGANRWEGSSDWKWGGGMLVNDGTNDRPSYILAPSAFTTSDYAIEAEIETLERDAVFGVFLRRNGGAGYLAGIAGTAPVLAVAGSGPIYPSPDTRTRSWTIVVEAKGNLMRLIVNGLPEKEMRDNRFLSGSKVGLWSLGSAVKVRKFKVTAL
jgi:hypothetical protein